MIFPWFLIIIGVIFLLENLNLIPAINWSIVWPLIIILAGVSMLTKRAGDGCCGWFNRKEDKK